MTSLVFMFVLGCLVGWFGRQEWMEESEQHRLERLRGGR